MQYRFIAGNIDRSSVEEMCECLGLRRSGYYDWQVRDSNNRDPLASERAIWPWTNLPSPGGGTDHLWAGSDLQSDEGVGHRGGLEAGIQAIRNE